MKGVIQMPEYPSTLPCPLQIGTIKVPETFSVTEFEHSNRYRKTFQCDSYVDFEFLFDKSEMNEFMVWYQSNLQDGSLWFLADWEILGDNTNEFHFNKPPTFEIQEQYFRLKANFNVRNI